MEFASDSLRKLRRSGTPEPSQARESGASRQTRRLANLRPRVHTIDYEVLRTSMRSILAGGFPQVNEVRRVLEHMAQIASQDESSVAEIDYEKDGGRLHITDPFFAFLPRWGGELIDAYAPGCMSNYYSRRRVRISKSRTVGEPLEYKKYAPLVSTLDLFWISKWA